MQQFLSELHELIIHVIDHPARIIGYIIAVSCFVWISYLTYKKGAEVWEDLKGDDGKWQIIEVTGVVWIFLFPTVVLLDILGLSASTPVWASLDTIFIALIGGKALLYRLHQNGKKKSNERTQNIS